MSLINNILSGARGHVVGRFFTSEFQNPTELGAAGVVRIRFGPGGTTTDGAVTVAADGLITQNLGRPFEFRIALSVGRDDPAGVSRVMIRQMVALDGIEANAVQIGETQAIEIDTANTNWIERVEAIYQFPAGALTWLELARDEDGNDSGGLITNPPTGTLLDWDDGFTAGLIIRTV